jgi:hypothetical protein
MNNMRLEELSFNELKFLKSGLDAKNKSVFGIKRQVKLHLDKLEKSINKNGWVFPLIVAELPNKEKWLIDGYARWKKEDPNYLNVGGGFAEAAKKLPALIIQAKDLDHVKELYLQNKSSYGTANYEDLKNLLKTKDNINSKEKLMYSEYSQYELPGIDHPNFDLSIMTREEVAKEMLKQKYQII